MWASGRAVTLEHSKNTALVFSLAISLLTDYSFYIEIIEITKISLLDYASILMIAQPPFIMDLSSWQNLLEEHHSLLNKHLDTIALVQQHTGTGTSGAQMLQSCVQQTEAAVQTFKLSAYKFMEELQSTKQSQPPQATILTPTRTGGVTGPTPAEQVLQSSGARKAVIRTKRKAPGEEPTPTPAALPAAEGPRKRVRTATSSRSGTATPRTQQTRSTSSPPPPRPTVEEDDDDSFLRAVDAKLKEKEEKVWKSMVKKRKRSSEASDTVEEHSTRTPATSSKPRKKTRQTLTQVEGDVVIEHAYTPQQEKQPNKRSSPATEYMESILRGADVKRQKATRGRGIPVE